jgi:hypothetical protein
MAPKYPPHAAVRRRPQGSDKELGKARAMANILAAQSAEMRAKGEAIIQQANKLLCESWNERMWSDGEPIDPSTAARSASIAPALSSCSRSALSSTARAFAVAFSRRSRSLCLAASSRRRSASRRLCSFSKSAAAFLAPRSLMLGASWERLGPPAWPDACADEPCSRRIPGRTGDRSAPRSAHSIPRGA